MGASRKRQSIFSQKLDRVAFIAYFLGAVVPLAALAVVVQRYLLPTVTDRLLAFGLIGLVVSIGVLSFCSFLVLRRTARESLRRLDGDKRRLAALLDVSSTLSSVVHGGDAAATAARYATELTGARAAFVVVRGESGGPPVLLESAGKDAGKLYQSLGRSMVELTQLVMSEGKPALRGRAGRTDNSGITSAAVVPLAGETAPLGVLAVVQTEPGSGFNPAEVDSLSTLAGLVSVALRNADLQDAQRNFFTHVIDILNTALDSHLDYHTGHGTRVAKYANPIGHDLGFDDRRMQRLHFAALLHDIGMLKFDRSLQKNSKACQKHTVLGYRMLNRIRLWQDIAPIVHHHHEWFDGNGYPEGIAGDAIPLESRVIGLCEAFDSMTSSTSYKTAMTMDDALRQVRDGAGTQFDPQVVRAFLGLVERGVIELNAES
jgi:putative nucleotidyltransferase with HDIG domain